MLTTWIIDKLEPLNTEPFLIVRDPLDLLSQSEGALDRFGKMNHYTVIIASTNLAFRNNFEAAMDSEAPLKLLLIDRTPLRRRVWASMEKAPPPFYPDLLARTAPTARIDISLRQFLMETTGDPNWPQETDEPRFARLIAGSLTAVLKAYANLRVAHASRFTDQDFKSIVAFAALGVPEAAFKQPEVRIYWHIALNGHPILQELDTLAPEVARAIRDKLRLAPAPFCWFADAAPEPIVRAFYLATILAQHIEHWKLLLAGIDSELRAFSDMDAALIAEAAPALVLLNPQRANRDLMGIEASLSAPSLTLILIEHLQVTTPERWADIIQQEQYSTLIRSLALLTALDNLLSDTPALSAHATLHQVLFAETNASRDRFIEERSSPAWNNLKKAYDLVRSIADIRADLSRAVKHLKVQSAAKLTFQWFYDLWKDRRVNRLEYYLSALERLVHGGDVLPRAANDLPPVFTTAGSRIRDRVELLREDTQKMLATLNACYQEFIAASYPAWVAADAADVRLTSQFLRRCLKPHWDPQCEKAVVFVFDGMRYDIWDELVRPVFEDRMEMLADYPASSLLPSETHISRKAIFAGIFPDQFNTRRGEDALLTDALQREFNYDGTVEVVAPEGLGTGETVRYRAGNIDFIIFELCDKALHHIAMKPLPDGRWRPSRPLAFIYQQHIKDIIDTEVMALVRNLAPNTKVFVVADHGFGPIGRERLGIEPVWLNVPHEDCTYLNAWLRQSLSQAGAPRKVRDRVWEFAVADLRMPETGEAFDSATRQPWQKTFASIIFPKTGWALARPKARFNPDAYSHGGISLPENIIPMIAMRVKAPEEGLLLLDPITGPQHLVEGQRAEFRMPVHLATSQTRQEARIEIQAAYQNRETTPALPAQVQYISFGKGEVVVRFVPDATDASSDEQKVGTLERTLKISVTFRDGPRTIRKARDTVFSLRLNCEKISRRVPAHLGKVLGMMPKGLR